MVEGVPLGIELAASRLRLLTPKGLLERLDRALPLLAERAAPTQPLVKTPTPGKSTCEDVAQLLDLPLASALVDLGLEAERGRVARVALQDFLNLLERERVFVFDNEIFPLGIPLKIKQLPLDLTGGWRFPLGPVTPFAGGGVTFLRYDETSDFADDEERIREWNTGFVALAGVEVRVASNVHVRGDVRYRRLNDAIGVGGVSEEFGESTLGGTGISLKVVFGR